MTVLGILAGGVSERMGQDKAFLDDGRGPNLARLVKLALDLGWQVIVAGRDKPDAWNFTAVEFVPDAAIGHGPIAGVIAVLERYESAICIACDAVAVEYETLLWLKKQARPNGFVVRCDNKPEPLFAYYTRQCLDIARQQLAAGERSLHQLITTSGMDMVDAPLWLVPHLKNVNTPAEWEEYLRGRTLQQQT